MTTPAAPTISPVPADGAGRTGNRLDDPAVLLALARDMERSLIDLQGPLDALELLADALDIRQATALAWLVSTAARSASELRGQWERLHEMASPARGR
ncbi:hypothetical protein [Arenibaculum sp.]|jgi:hypothetical protein|uniref:hypothetical protein n=1 Tax=Arenibaculum sp. TaxID=2865862 RepID=UPI002E158AC3|nr:hypothetical protein [Arenibaculum sp.]